MYDIYPKSLKEFIEDSSIKLPRFQRKATWEQKKRFELALSIFKNYPLGASILSREVDEKKNLTKWLLDGRQRRDTMKMIYDSPDVLFTWGKKYLPIKKGDNFDEINRNFWDKVSDFIEEENQQTGSQVQGEDYTDAYSESETVSDALDGAEYERNDQKNRGEEELTTLLMLLQISFNYCHGKDVSGLTSSFDFKEALVGKAYKSSLYDKEDKVDCKKLRVFLRNYKQLHSDDYAKVETFIQFLDESYEWKDQKTRVKFENQIKTSWNDQQLKIIECFDKIDLMFMNRKIAIIETHDITPTDSQKIFNLINTGGTKLTASEILSAKPKWNVSVSAPGSEISQAVKQLYSMLELGSSVDANVVKWDIPAACTYYFDKDKDNSGFNLFFRLDDDDIANRITIGFKLFAGFITEGVKKENIDDLSSKIDWTNYESILQELKTFFDTFIHNPYLMVIKSWGKCLSDVLSDGPTMNLLFLLYRSWIELGKPVGYLTAQRSIYDKNIFIELDKSFYAYITNQWKGSSDSTIAKNLLAFKNGNGRNSDGLFVEQSSESWKTLLEGMFKDNTINGKPIVKGALAPLVYYYNCLKGLQGSGYTNPGEIDHIIPQSVWLSSSLQNKDSIQNNVFNLALLPKNTNGSKNNNTLGALMSDSSIANIISKYEEIPVSKFTNYSTTAGYMSLKEERENLYRKAFGEDRDNKLN